MSGQVSGSPAHENAASQSAADSAANAYALARPRYEEYTSKLADLLRNLLSAKGIDVHLIEARTKTVQSFGEKVSRAGKHYSEPLAEVTDLSGVRIIVYYQGDVTAVCEILAREFAVDESRSTDKRAELRAEEFGYQSVHCVIQLSPPRRDLSEWEHLQGLNAEIQVRTVLQHAWAAISHKLQYKREADIPPVLRRRLFRLSALLELADEEFVGIRGAIGELAIEIRKDLAHGRTDIEINVLSLDEFLRTSSEVGQLRRIGERVGFDFGMYERLGEEDTLSDLVRVCEHVGIASIADLQAELQASLPGAEAYLKAQLAESSMRWGVSPGFLVLLVLMMRYPDRFDLSELLRTGWGDESAARTLKVIHEYLRSRDL